MNGLKRVIAVAAGLILVLSTVTAMGQVVAGRDYRVLATPQPVASGTRIEVLEFFWYGCPHCNNLQPALSAWLKRKPADVEFKRVPAVFQDSWVPLTKAYFTIETMGLVDKLHHDLFAAIHEKKMRLQDPTVLFDWVAKQGVDREKFAQTYNSFAVQTRSQRAKDVTARYDIPGTPAIVVDGKYLTAPSLVLNPDNSINYDRYFRVLDEVIGLARRTRSSK
ncbi:MAG: disulfide bond formation protein DsbA [Burkholderiales bacterium]|jgi:thiol:disulfide interchange protein DsbA|nr:disulfide bond formation protein DsbA [Burkholderiales bacterium]